MQQIDLVIHENHPYVIVSKERSYLHLLAGLGRHGVGLLSADEGARVYISAVVVLQRKAA